MKKLKKTITKNSSRLKACKNVCHKWLVINDDTYIDVQFGVYFANQFLDSKPNWVYIVGPPGSGKTEILQAWDGHEKIYPLSNLTANTLISGKIQEEDLDAAIQWYNEHKPSLDLMQVDLH